MVATSDCWDTGTDCFEFPTVLRSFGLRLLLRTETHTMYQCMTISISVHTHVQIYKECVCMHCMHVLLASSMHIRCKHSVSRNTAYLTTRTVLSVPPVQHLIRFLMIQPKRWNVPGRIPTIGCFFSATPPHVTRTQHSVQMGQRWCATGVQLSQQVCHRARHSKQT